MKLFGIRVVSWRFSVLMATQCYGWWPSICCRSTSLKRLDGGGHSVVVRPSSVLASAEQRLGIRIVHFCLAAALSADWI